MKVISSGPLSTSIESYLAHKRSLGKQLVTVGSMLRLLDTSLLARGITDLHQIQPVHLDEFVASRHRRSTRSYNELIGGLRGLFDWLVVHEQLSTSPLRCKSRRNVQSGRPFLFSVEEVRMLLEAAAHLPDNPRAAHRGETYKMIFTLLYALGLRVGEVTRLCRMDVDLDSKIMTIRHSKFGKDRIVPFGPRLAHAIAAFLEREESRYGPINPEEPVFSFGKRNRRAIRTNTISWTFHKLVSTLQLTIPSGASEPHLHCLRHSFAVGTLLRWYQTGADPMSFLLDLSTFLGHVSPRSTAVYLTITTELLESANGRFAAFASTSRRECMP